MKDILIAAEMKSEVDKETCAGITYLLKQAEISFKRPLESLWVLSGPTSFKATTKIIEIASSKNLRVAVAEIESLLMAP